MVGIRLASISKRFGGTTAVDNVSLEIRKGELFFLLGPSGCGKTTILRMIAGFETPTEGTIHFDDRPILDVPAHKRNTGLVFQSYALWPHMTVAQNVAYGLDERRVPADAKAERVLQALRSVHMESYAARMPNQLSGGQQQRISLARALVIEPDVVLLDEPLSNLDARLRLEMRQEIRRIHEETGITMVYVTHDQKESLSMADTIAVMSMGRVEQLGDPRAIYRRPANRFVADFIGETNLIEGTLASREDGWGRVETDLGTIRARLGVNAPAAGAKAFVMVRPEGLRIGHDGNANRFKAHVTGNIYLGEVEEFRLQCGRYDFRVAMSNPGEASPRTGADVDVSFAAEDAVVLA